MARVTGPVTVPAAQPQTRETLVEALLAGVGAGGLGVKDTMRWAAAEIAGLREHLAVLAARLDTAERERDEAMRAGFEALAREGVFRDAKVAAERERDAVAVANCPALCMDFCNAYQVHEQLRRTEARLGAATDALRKAENALYQSFLFLDTRAVQRFDARAKLLADFVHDALGLARAVLAGGDEQEERA